MVKDSKRKVFSINPIMGTVLVAMIGLFGTGIGASIGGYYNIKLEKEKLRSTLILKAVETNDPQSALNYLKLLKDTGLVDDIDTTIETWSEDLESIPLRPALNQLVVEGVDNLDRDTRINAIEKLLKEETGNPQIIHDMLESLSDPKSDNGLWNILIFLNQTKKEAWDNELVQIAEDQISSLENENKKGTIKIGPKTQTKINTFKNKLKKLKEGL
jgi:hypothetical protein